MKFSQMLEEYLLHRDVVRHVFSSEVRGGRMAQKEYHKKKMEELAQVMDNTVRMIDNT